MAPSGLVFHWPYRFFNNVRSLSYPHDRISIGLLESDSDDVPPSALLDQLSGLAKSIPALKVVLRKYEERYQAPPPVVGLAPTTGNASRPEALTPVPHPAHVHGLALAQSTRLSGTLAHILAEVPSLQADFGRVAVFQVRPSTFEVGDVIVCGALTLNVP